MEQLLENKLNEISSLMESSQNILLFYDDDTDGLTSYYILRDSFNNIKQSFPYVKNNKKQSFLLSQIDYDGVDLVLFVDLADIDEYFLEHFKDKKIIIIDHHVPNYNSFIEKYDITYFNPLNFDSKDNRPACYWSWYLSGCKNSQLLNVVLGSVSDFFLLPVIKDLKTYDETSFYTLFPFIDNNQEKKLFDSLDGISWKEEEWIRYLTYDAGLIEFKNFFDFIFKMEDYKDILRSLSNIEGLDLSQIKEHIDSGKNFPFSRYYQQKKEVEKHLDEALNQESSRFFLYEYRGNESYTRAISEELMHRKSDCEIVMVCYKKIRSNYYSCSLRSRQVDLNYLIKKSLNGLDGNGGGHKHAAGLRIKKVDYQEFLEKFSYILENEF